MWRSAFVTGIAYWAAAVVSLWLTRGVDGIAAVWPPSGILLAALLLRPKAFWPRSVCMCAVASVVANLQSGNALYQTIGFTLANVVEPLVAALLCNRFVQVPSPFAGWRDVARFTGSAVTAAGASVSVATLFAVDPGTSFAASWFATDLLGMLVVCPALLMLRGSAEPMHLIRDGVALLAFTAVTAGVFFQTTFPLLFVPYAALLLITWSSGARGATGGLLVVAVIGSAASAAGRGPLSLVHSTMTVEAAMLQFYLLTLFASSLPVAALRGERRNAVRRLSESERAHRLLAEASSDIIVRFSLDGTPLYVSPACLPILGYDSLELMARGSTDDIHLEDLASVLAAWRGVATAGGEQTSIYRQRARDGRTVWLEAVYRRVPSANGDGHEIVGSARDVSRRVEAELVARETAAKLRAANLLLAEAEAVAHLGHWRVDLSSGGVFWSDEVGSMHDRKGHQPRDLPEALSYIHEEDRERVTSVFERAIADRTSFRFEARLVTAAEGERHVSCRGQPEIGGSGELCGLFGTLQDVSEWIRIGQGLDLARREAEDAAASAIALAETDMLTGVASRRRVLAWLDARLADTSSDGRTIAVIVADVDHFKQVNDRFGHVRGDMVLRDIADALRTTLRQGDLVGRLGGEEFLVICDVKDGEEARMLADRLRRSVVASLPGGLSVTASFGVATSSGTETAVQLIDIADQALYSAKRAGRDAVRLAA